MRFITLVFLLFVGCSAKPDGAPSSACTSMTPYHGGGIPVQRREHLPYTVTAEKSGNKITVTISSPSGEEFQGFMLQARSKDKRRLIEGTFSSSPQVSKTIDCLNGKKNTLTHVNTNSKREVVTEWTPSNGVNEEIIFRASVAKTYSLFWTEIDSTPVKIESGGHEGLHGSSSNSAKAHNLGDTRYDGCGITKGCFGYPTGCAGAGDCEVLLSFSKVSNGIMFKLDGTLKNKEYMAMGLSTDAVMGDDSVTECYRDDSRVSARVSYNEGKRNTRTRDLPSDRYEGSFSDGWSSCSWISPFLTSANQRSYDLENDAYHVLLAKGEISNRGLGYHGESRIASAEPISFTSVGHVVGAGVTDAVKVHGETDEITSLQYSKTAFFTDASTEAKPTAINSEKPNASSDSLQPCFNHMFLLALLGFIFYANCKHFIGNLV